MTVEDNGLKHPIGQITHMAVGESTTRPSVRSTVLDVDPDTEPPHVELLKEWWWCATHDADLGAFYCCQRKRLPECSPVTVQVTIPDDQFTVAQRPKGN